MVEGAHESLKNHTYAHGIVDTKELRNSMTLIIIKGNQILHAFLLVYLQLLNLHQRTLGSHLFPFCICTFYNTIIYHVTNHESSHKLMKLHYMECSMDTTVMTNDLGHVTST